MNSDLVIRAAHVDEIRPLRHIVLRAGLPFSEATFEKDDEPTTRHVGAFLSSGENAGCATIVRNHWNGEPAWQLRGMAVRDGSRSRGVGRLLLDAIEEIVVREQHCLLLWCNARVQALPFYSRLGWTAVGEQFHIPTAGSHFQMYKRLR